MESGKLRHRVTIERPTTASGSYGYSAKPTWTPVATRWAFVRPLRAAEMIRAGQPAMETTYVVRMRFTDLVTPDCRLSWEGQTLHISSVVDVDGRHVELEIMAHEREPAQTHG